MSQKKGIKSTANYYKGKIPEFNARNANFDDIQKQKYLNYNVSKGVASVGNLGLGTYNPQKANNSRVNKVKM